MKIYFFQNLYENIELTGIDITGGVSVRGPDYDSYLQTLIMYKGLPSATI